MTLSMPLTASFSRTYLSLPQKTHIQPLQALHQQALIPKTTSTTSSFPRSNPSLRMTTTPFINTPLMSDSDTESDDDDDDLGSFNGLQEIFTPFLVKVSVPEHPFVIEGNNALSLIKEDEESFYVRVDLPGVEKETVNLWIDKDFVYIEGVEAKKDADYDKESARKYQKRFSLPLADCKTGEIKAQVKDGVLRVVIPKLKLEDREGVVKLLVN